MDEGKKLQAGHAREPEVRQDERSPVKQGESLFGGGGKIGIELRGSQMEIQNAAKLLFVFDDQDSGAHQRPEKVMLFRTKLVYTDLMLTVWQFGGWGAVSKTPA